MASVTIQPSDIPSLEGKIALITGGSSGIGLGAVKILAERGAKVHVLDINPPLEEVEGVTFHKVNVASWTELRDVFDSLEHIDYAFANAGVLEETDYFADSFDAEGRLAEPTYRVDNINTRGVYNVVKLAWSKMRKQSKDSPYSIVLTTSLSAYCPEQGFPIYSSGKVALVGLIRALRSIIVRDNITINGVAPAATATNIGKVDISKILTSLGVSVAAPEHVGRALVYSAVATQSRRVQVYGKDKDTDLWQSERWNGRVILALGNTYTELEEPMADLRQFWLGRENVIESRRQQAIGDKRAFD
ncbi:hypothetical protein S40285_06511 [Stachybotrys chlorohalonatus IBT 40285]|uniref:Uncharacterized protein n=1 Tax=Stachybotrys chlorohalonatus (strain IBT 40285) TaxID=1283841 RepID=A0A084QMG2_STAC4|nr:hypothetical protein S40285_06511 [Stachybotrys chlorohalonata IBT 40285]